MSLKISDVYSYYLAHWLAGGRLQLQDKISGIGIRAVYDRILTKGKVTKIWCITSIPVQFGDEDKGPINITHAVRTTMHRMHPSVKTNILVKSDSISDLNTGNEIFSRQMNEAFEVKNAFDRVINEMNDAERLTSKKLTDPSTGRTIVIRPKDIEKANSLSSSYEYVFSHKSGGGEFAYVLFYIIATCKDNRELEMYSKSLNNYLTGLRLGFFPLKGSLGKFLKNKAPAGLPVEHNYKLGEYMLMSDENLAAILPFKTSGIVGGKGVQLGVDVRSKAPFLWDFSSSAAAQVILYLAKAGYGKSYAAFQAILSLAGDNHHSMVFDIKGDEWNRLKHFVNTQVIDLGGSNPRFVNTLRLDELSLTPENTAYLFNAAVDDTVMLMSLMVNLNENEGNSMDLDTILREAVLKLYSQNGVTPKAPSTFKKTSELRYADLITLISNMSSSSSYTSEQKKLCQLIMVRCNNFISEQGTYSMALDNEISLSEVIDSTVVVFSLNKNKETTLNTVDTIRMFMATSLTMRKMAMRKEQGLFTDIVFEELSRCEQFGKILDFIVHIVTGARSSNATVLLLLNSISTLMIDTDHVTADTKKTHAIASNITHKIIGKVEESDINILVKHFGCSAIKDELTLMNESVAYANTFTALMDNKLEKDICMFRVHFPEQMSEVFVTRETREHTLKKRETSLKEFFKPQHKQGG